MVDARTAAVAGNIQAVIRMKEGALRQRGLVEQVADAIASFAGSVAPGWQSTWAGHRWA